MRRTLVLVAAITLLASGCHEHPGLHYDPETIPPSSALPVGSSTMDIAFTGQGAAPSDGTGNFRTQCAPSHYSRDDPIMMPGEDEAMHLHTFFGNVGVDENSTGESIATTGNSTCAGGIANRTAYWVPTMLSFDGPTDTTGDVVSDFHDTGAHVPGWADVPSPAGQHGLQVYYKSGYQGVLAETIVAFPPGLAMVAGHPAAEGPTGASDPVVQYACIDARYLGPVKGGESIPSCVTPGPQGQQRILVMVVRFPQCWDGVHLTPGEMSEGETHVVYGLGWPDRGCPASHPVGLPEITMLVRYWVHPSDDTTTWRLSCDAYSYSEGYSGPYGFCGHADWWNGWHEETEAAWLDNCYYPPVDCHLNPLGDGRELVWSWP